MPLVRAIIESVGLTGRIPGEVAINFRLIADEPMGAPVRVYFRIGAEGPEVELTRINTGACPLPPKLAALPLPGAPYRVYWDAANDLGPVRLRGVVVGVRPLSTDLLAEPVEERALREHGPFSLDLAPPPGCTNLWTPLSATAVITGTLPTSIPPGIMLPVLVINGSGFDAIAEDIEAALFLGVTVQVFGRDRLTVVRDTVLNLDRPLFPIEGVRRLELVDRAYRVLATSDITIREEATGVCTP